MANVFIDFSASNDGDGTTAAQAGSPGGVGAFKTFVGHAPAVGDKWWFRRAGTLSTGSQSFTVSNVQYIGWPISTDVDYATRPASGISNNWDSDSTATLPIISTTSAATITISTGILQQ